MRHRVTGRKLGRNQASRLRLFRGLVAELVFHGKIQTTLSRAKAVQPLIDALVSDAKKATLSARRELVGTLPKGAGTMLMDTIAPGFTNRTSGFSRIVKLGPRKGDNSESVILEWVEEIRKLPFDSAGDKEVGNGKSQKTTKGKETKELKKKTLRKRKAVKKT